MEKSLSPGAPSSAPMSRSELTQALREIARTPALQKLLECASDETQLYLVGGSVRDIALGAQQIDFDLASNLAPNQISQYLGAAGHRVIETGLQHGTITALIDSTPIEITTFRQPLPSHPVSYSDNIEIDLSARDFTINAIAFDLKQHRLIDPFDGLSDLANQTLRAVGSPQDRFKEDPLRILRMIRFGPAANRTVEDLTWTAASRQAKTISTVSIERIKEELDKILLGINAPEGFRALAKLNLLELTVPELIPCIGFEQNDFHLHDVFDHTLAVLERCPKDNLALRLTALYHDLGKPSTLSVDPAGNRHFYKHEIISEEICSNRMQALKYSKRLTKQVTRLVRYHMRPIECGPAGVRRLMRDLEEDFDLWQEFKFADKPPVMSDQ
ncbi:MAG: HD domain-containing protein, partial [Bdellovibrionales bacterium]|nr:HD domain-containing protein [Bdellovibrionales bacterium]